MEPQIQYATTSDGVSIAHFVMGEGQPLVYTSNVWGDIQWYLHNEPTRREMDRLIAADWSVVRYDMRGMGFSDREVSDFSLTARVLDLEAVVASTGIDRFVLCGYGHGGPPAISYAAHYPERVSHLILVNSFAQGTPYYQNLPVMRALVSMRAMAEEQWEFVTQTIATASLGFEDTVLAKRTAEMYRNSASAKTYYAFHDAAEKIDILNLLPEVKVPTLVVLDRSGYMTEDLSRALASRIPGARYVVTDDYAAELHSFVRGEALAPAVKSESVGAGTAIILFADIADSTRLTESLGDAAFRAKSRDLDSALRTLIREHAGNAIEGKVLGDGVMAVFTSARQAITCAASCHAAATDVGLELHIGIHAGDVIRESDNVFGGAVNIAARVAAASAAGETLVSQTVRDLARTSAGVSFEDRGEQALKGIDDPVRLFAVR